MYDTQWRIVATYHESDSDPKEQFVYHAPGSGSFGGIFGGDDVILRDKAANTDWDIEADGTLEDRVYYCQNWRHDVVAIVDDSGAQVEQTRYSPYGIPFGLPAGDMDSDGDVDGSDAMAHQVLITYDVRGDLDLDGDTDQDDRDIIDANIGNTAGLNVLSVVGNRKGYAGYEFEDALAVTQRFYHVRHRVLNSDLGRWTRRDPVGYVDGSNLYEYASRNILLSENNNNCEEEIAYCLRHSNENDIYNFRKIFEETKSTCGEHFNTNIMQCISGRPRGQIKTYCNPRRLELIIKRRHKNKSMCKIFAHELLHLKRLCAQNFFGSDCSEFNETWSDMRNQICIEREAWEGSGQCQGLSDKACCKKVCMSVQENLKWYDELSYRSRRAERKKCEACCEFSKGNEDAGLVDCCAGGLWNFDACSDCGVRVEK